MKKLKTKQTIALFAIYTAMLTIALPKFAQQIQKGRKHIGDILRIDESTSTWKEKRISNAIVFENENSNSTLYPSLNDLEKGTSNPLLDKEYALINQDIELLPIEPFLTIQDEYTLEELRLIVDPTLSLPQYYFVKKEDTYFKENETKKEISPINFYTYLGSNDLEETLHILPLRFTITKNSPTLSASANLPCYELKQSAWIPIVLPKEFQNQTSFTKEDLLKIETYYNNNFDWEYNYFQNQYRIASLYIAKQNEETLIISEDNAIVFENENSNITLYPSLNDLEKGILNKTTANKIINRFASSDPLLDQEYALINQDIEILPIESFLSEEQLQNGYLTKEEIIDIAQQQNISIKTRK